MPSDKDSLETPLANYKFAVDGWKDIYTQALDDLRFVYDVDGGQWTDEATKDRKGRPKLTINKLLKFVRQVRGDLRINKPSIRAIPAGGGADIDKAAIYNGLIKFIEYASNADIAYDTAYMYATSASIGFFRIVTEYADDNSFNQDIKIKRIVNPFTVHYDPSAMEYNLEDAEYCFIEESIPVKVFKKLYPGADTSGFKSKGVGADYQDWFRDDMVRICEYFYKEDYKKKIGLLNTGEVIELDDGAKLKAYLFNNNLTVEKEREVCGKKVMWQKMSGKEVLDSKTEWAGKYIPIIPVFGDEVVVNGKRYLFSLIRGAKDPQRIYNYWSSAATETVALAPKAPIFVDHRQIEGFEKEWNEINTAVRPYVRYKHIAGLGKPTRERQTEIPSAIMGMIQQTAFDLEDHLGKYEASKGAPSNERSGLAIQVRINQSERGNITFIDNFTRALLYAGRQIIDLTPKIYDVQRALNIIGDDDEVKSVAVNVQDGNGNIVNDLTVGKFDVIASMSQSFSTKRMEAATMTEKAMQYAPTLAPIIAPFMFKYSDWEGAKEIAAAIEKATQPPPPPPMENIPPEAIQGGGMP